MVRAMKRTALIIVLLAACGGGKKSSTAPDTTDQARTGEPATPTEPATPAEPTTPGTPEPQKPDEGAMAQAALTEQYELGKKVYAEKGCAKCHGDAGAGSKTS